MDPAIREARLIRRLRASKGRRPASVPSLEDPDSDLTPTGMVSGCWDTRAERRARGHSSYAELHYVVREINSMKQG